MLETNNLIKIFFIWIFSIFFVFIIACFYNQPDISLSDSFINVSESWDGGHFLNISENGYNQNYLYAFFPLFPIILGLANKFLLINSAVVSTIINMFFAYGFIVFFYKLLVLDYDNKIALKVIILFLLYPYTFFLLLPYSESLFLFIAVLFFLSLFKRQLINSTVLVMLALFTRISGLFLLPVYLYEYSKAKQMSKRLIILVPILFIIGYLYYLFIKTGDPFVFVNAETIYWKRGVSFPGIGILNGINNFIQYPARVSSFLEIISVIFGVGLVIRSLPLLRREYLIYSVTGLTIYLCLSSIISFPRFLLVIFPIFITFGLINNKKFTIIYILICLVLNIFNIFSFVRGNWVS